MKLLLTTNGRLVKNDRGEYFTPVVYSYAFFERYLEVFDEIELVAHCEQLDKIPDDYLRVDGERLSVIEVPFPHGKVEYVEKFLSIKKTLKQKIRNTDFDVAVLRIPDQLSFQVFNVIKRMNKPIGAEIVSSSWDIMAPDVSSSPLRPFIRAIWDYNEKNICRKADATCYVTEHFLQTRYKPNETPGHFTIGCSDASITETAPEPKRYSDDKDSYTFLHVSADIGGLIKGHLELVEAVGKLKNDGIETKAVIVGNGELAPEVKKAISDYSLENDITLTGRLNKEQLSAEYKKADIFVFPSYREGLPRVIVEAMAYALPVVATDIPGIRELIDSDCLVPVKDTNALYQKLKTVLNNPYYLEKQSAVNLTNSKKYLKNVLQAKRNRFYNWLGEQCNERKEKD